MTPLEKRLQTIAENHAAAKVNGERLRRRRLEAGLTAKRAAQAAGVTLQVWRLWEVGNRPYPARRLPAIAAALGIPVMSLLVDRFVLAELQVSDESLERVRREGRPAAAAIVAAIAPGLEAALLAEAGRPAIDLSPWARARPRRSREQVLAGSFHKAQRKLPQGAAQRPPAPAAG